MVPSLVRIENLTMSYGAVPVLRELELSLAGGEIVGLLGENGAGKSTLAKLLRGLIFPDCGRLLIDDRPIAPHDDRVAGIPQESTLAPDLTIAENIFLGRELSRGGLLKKQEMLRRSREALLLVGSDLDPARLAGSLTAAEKQQVELARVFLYDGCRLLIMDEPTTILNNAETERLFRLLRKRREEGTAILYISHKLDEVRELCDRAVVLRDGVAVWSGVPRELSAPELAGKMVGRPLDRLFPEPLPENPDAASVLQAEHLSDGGKVADVSLTLHAGEILGIAGLAGAGRSEFAEIVAGLRPRRGGKFTLFGEPRRFHSGADAVAAGISLVPEDRREEGVFPEFSVAWNMTLTALSRLTGRGGCLLSPKKERGMVQQLMTQFTLHPADPGLAAGALSGGNQQKMLMARGIASAPRIFLFDEPTRGVDVAARYEIYCAIRHLASLGMGCILISSDLPELIGMCRRVVVFRDGRSVGECTGEDVNEKNLICLATGAEK